MTFARYPPQYTRSLRIFTDSHRNGLDLVLHATNTLLTNIRFFTVNVYGSVICHCRPSTCHIRQRISSSALIYNATSIKFSRRHRIITSAADLAHPRKKTPINTHVLAHYKNKQNEKICTPMSVCKNIVSRNLYFIVLRNKIIESYFTQTNI